MSVAEVQTQAERIATLRSGLSDLLGGKLMMTNGVTVFIPKKGMGMRALQEMESRLQTSGFSVEHKDGMIHARVKKEKADA